MVYGACRVYRVQGLGHLGFMGLTGCLGFSVGGSGLCRAYRVLRVKGLGVQSSSLGFRVLLLIRKAGLHGLKGFHGPRGLQNILV